MLKLPTHEIERLDAQAYAASEKTPLVLVLDNIRSALNVGSIFRTADAFALEHLYLCGITATPPSRDIMKTAIGADQTVDWTHAPTTLSVIADLRQQGYQIYAVEQTSEPILLQDLNFNSKEAPRSVTDEGLTKVANPKQIAIILGNEVTGVDQAVLDKCDGAIEVPQFGTKHSLNVAVCTGVVVWEILRQIRL